MQHPIIDKLVKLAAADKGFNVFGANSHRYETNHVLSEPEVRVVEEKYRFTLPKEYRWFVTTVGNGGAGPFYGIFPLGKHDAGHDLTSWEKGGLVGSPGLPFQHAKAWNLPPAFWADQPDPGEEVSEEEEDALWEAWDQKLEEKYWDLSVMQGAIPICHEGCALRNWLVTTGPLAGNIWRDMRADNEGIAPLKNANGTPMSFVDWYLSWLDTHLSKH